MQDGGGLDIKRVTQAVGFVHLHAHTSFSLREGALTIANLIKLAKADEQPALAITDTNNLFGALEFFREGLEGGHSADHRLPAHCGFRRGSPAWRPGG
jgi:hypothetical protein